jgi:hypothetical protein
MWSKFKALPVVPKMLIVFFILVLVYGMTHRKPVYRDRDVNWSEQPTDERGSEARRASQLEQSSESNARSQMLANYQAQQAQLMAQARECEQQMNEATRQQAMAAMNGQMYNPRPACEAAMPQMIAQEAFLETEIYKLQGGDQNATVREVSGIAPPQYGGSPYSSASSSSGSSTDPVDTWDRQAIRGNSLYTDETGEEHELATRPYYFRDRASGALIGSDSPTPPYNGRDYEVIQPQAQQ